MGFYTGIVAPTIFALTRRDPEPAHRLGILGLKVLSYQPLYGIVKSQTMPIGLKTRAFGIMFDSPLGIAAGFDKHGEGVTGASTLGIGHDEVGTVVPRPQPGNPRPRLSRNVAEETLRNWYGFNSVGVHKVDTNLMFQRPGTMRLGINVGANKDTPVDVMYMDYVECIRRLYGYASYFTVNISSPNTPGLRTLQEPARIDKLLTMVQARLDTLNRVHGKIVPYVVKTANDLPVEATLEVAERVVARGGSGMVIGNTRMVNREGGGVAGESGPPLFDAVLERIYAVKKKYPQLDLVSAGGHGNGDNVWKALNEGATLCQIYTAMVYRGPFIFHKINGELLKKGYARLGRDL